MVQLEFEWQSFDGIKIFSQAWVPDDLPKAVINIVHGLGEHCGRYSYIAEIFTQERFAVISSDLRGHGKSGGKRGHAPSFEAFMKDMDLLLDKSSQRYAGLPHFLWGHSLGGILVTNYVLRRKPQLAGVVVTSPGFHTSIANQKGKVWLARVLGAVLPEMSMATGLQAELISHDPEVVTSYIQDPLVHGVATLAMAKNTIEAIPWVFEHAKEWTLPVLVMHGDADEIAYVSGSREFATRIPANCTLKIWPGYAHETHNEPGKKEVLAYALGWMDSQLSL